MKIGIVSQHVAVIVSAMDPHQPSPSPSLCLGLTVGGWSGYGGDSISHGTHKSLLCLIPIGKVCAQQSPDKTKANLYQVKYP